MKATTDKLLEEIADDFTQFLKYGNLTSFSKQIEPNLNIDNIEKLLRIHFVLTSKKNNNDIGVIDFIERLPERLRRIKTTTKQDREVFEGEVRGRINWSDTIKKRYNQDPKSKTQFVCDRMEKNYENPENLVLKSLLHVIYEIIYKDLNLAFEKEYKWLNEWVEEKELKNILNQLFLRNVYLKKINLNNIVVTDRMINKVIKSRIPLYKEAAFLLFRYRKLMKYELDSKEAKELLKNTFIKPEKIDILFELYWVIKIVKHLKNPKFQLIEPDKNVVAKCIVNKHKYIIYHDSNGIFEFIESTKNLNINLENKDNYVGRQLKVLEKIEQMTQIKSDSLWGGRPSIILEKYDEDDNIIFVFIGEVKHTNDKDYAIRGLKELLEYMALIKENGVYLENYDNLFGQSRKVKGGLFLDKIDDLNIISDDDIQIVMFGEEFKINF